MTDRHIHAAVGDHAQQVAVGEHITQTLIMAQPLPDTTRTQLAMIAASLADLYPDEPSTRRLIAWAELDAKLIPFDQPILNTWYAAVVYAHRQRRLPLLVQLALEEYPLDEYLIAYHATLTQESAHGQ